jgi:K+ transporter
MAILMSVSLDNEPVLSHRPVPAMSVATGSSQEIMRSFPWLRSCMAVILGAIALLAAAALEFAGEAQRATNGGWFTLVLGLVLGVVGLSIYRTVRRSGRSRRRSAGAAIAALPLPCVAVAVVVLVIATLA